MNREFNDAEAAFLTKMRAHLRQMAADAELAPTAPPTPDILDSLWRAWAWSDRANEDEQKVAIFFFGFGFGDYLAAETGMKWRIVSDEHGSDYALVHPTSDATLFPLATVAKRLGQQAFFSSLAPAIIKDVETVAGPMKP